MRKLIIYLSAIIVFFVQIETVWSQCSNCGSQYPGTTQSTTSGTLTEINSCMYGGDYAVCNVTTGETYEWTTCIEDGYDTQLTLYNSSTCSGTVLSYNDDACGTQSTITWTATYTGTVSILVSEYNCLSNSTCQTLEWRCTSCTSTVVTAGDCSAAVNVCTDLGFQIDANGVGAINEIPALGTIGNPDNNNPGGSGNSGCLRVGEKNSTWMIINVNGSGNLQFNFGGASQAGYYDWIMYPYTATSCTDIPAGTVAPVRCNWNSSSTGGTGLSNSDPNGNFEPPLPVQCGDRFIICFSNYSAAATNVPLVFSGTATVDCLPMTCAGNAMCNPTPGPAVDQDCISAIPVCQNIYCQEYAYSGTGNVPNEIDLGPSCLNSGEKNDVWYTFSIISSGNLNFSITPNDITDDYDWGVYNLTSANCTDIYTNSALEVSCNWSGATGVTGANGQAGAQNMPVVPVTAGQTYVLNVSNYTASQSGYILDFSASTAVIVDNVPPVFSALTTTPTCGATSIAFNFSENILCSTIDDCDFTLTSPTGTYTLSGLTGLGCAGTGTQENSFTINVSPALTATGSYSLNLVAGCASVTDLCGNVAAPGSKTFSISGPSVIVTKTNPSCNGGNNGTASASVSGGTPNYTYTWSTGATTTTALTTNAINGLSAGTCSVTVSTGGCTATGSVTLTEPAAMVLTATSLAATCGSNNGSATVTVNSGGATPFDYLWSNTSSTMNVAATTNTISPIACNTYWVTVTDNNNCTQTASTTVGCGSAVTSSISYDGNKCDGLNYDFTNTGTTGGGATFLWTFTNGTPASSTEENPSNVTFPVGTHNVTLQVTQGGCPATSSVLVSVYDIPTLTVTSTNITCNGSCNGIATANPAGGSGIYNYVWSNTTLTQTNSNLCPGTYSVTVTDTYACTVTGSTTITQPPALALTATRTNILCPGACSGTANAAASGGSGCYNYIWNTAQTTANITSLCPGTYTVTISDCASPTCVQTQNVVITEPAPMVLTGSSTNASCGSSNGTATITVSGGTPNYDYNWSTGDVTLNTATTSNTIVGKPSGACVITVTDDNGCTMTSTVNINDDGSPTANITASTNILCYGAATGSATVTITGTLNQPFNYEWSNGTTVNNTASTNHTISGLTDDVYMVTVTDINGCTSSAAVTITEPLALTATATKTDPNCGLSTGSASVTVFGGVGTYTYLWSNGGTTSSISNLPAGIYSVTATDQNSCTVSASVTLTDVGGITASVSGVSHVTCYGLCNGEATAAGSGGTPGYTYIWSDGQTTALATGLCAGVQSVTVTDLAACTAITTVTITEPALLTSSVSSSTPVSCSGGSNGTATAQGTGGTGVYTYHWSNNDNFATADSLLAQTYNVTVTDASSSTCTATASIIITQPTAITLTTSTTSAFCGNDDGSATVTALGGSGGYTYSWSTAPVQTTATATGLSPTLYSVIVTDSNGCTATTNATVANIPAGTVTISSFTNVTCNGLCNGTATASMAGGTAPFTILWDVGQSTINATGLCPGTHSVSVTDANSCLVTVSVTITEPAVLTSALTINNVSCNGACDGTIHVVINGGTLPYNYQWDDPGLQQSATAFNLCAGTYHVTTTDANGCSVADTGVVTEPIAIVITSAITSSTCGQADGAINLTVSGGTPDYDFEWLPAATTEDLPNITAGTYLVTVTDSKSCTETGLYQVNDLSGPTVSITTFEHVSCFGLSDAYATATITGGQIPYTINWSDGQPTITATNLIANVYSINVSDTNNCVATATVTITQPAALACVLATTPPECNGDCNGSATITNLTGGVLPYTITWGTGASSGQICDSICAGSYILTITDANNCVLTKPFNLAEHPLINLSVTTTQALCNGSNTGTATASATGGSGGFTYIWTDNQTTAMATNLGVGPITVTVYDSESCQQSQTVTITAPAALNATIDNFADVTCFAGCNGWAQVTVNGGSAPYTFLWSNDSTTQTITGLCQAVYWVTVTDFNGCIDQTSIIINQPPQLIVTLDAYTETCFEYGNGHITANVEGGTEPIEYFWNTLDSIPALTDLDNGTYLITVTDDNGCKGYAAATLDGPDLLQLGFMNITPATCGENNGFMQIYVLGGVPYSYIYWSNGCTSVINDSLYAGTHCVTVVDDNGCNTDTCISLNNLNGPVIDTLTTNDITCFGLDNGTATINITCGNPQCDITWSNLQTGSLATGLAPGTHSVSVTDAIGCIASLSFSISEPPLLNSAIPFPVAASCYGYCDGNASVQVFGGIQPYTYAWITQPVQTTPMADSLCSGNYSVVTTDDNGCTTAATVMIAQPDPIGINGYVTDVTCFGSNNGIITLTQVTGGTAPFSYLWPAIPSANPTVGPLAPGEYLVQVTDQHQCTGTQNYTVTEPAQIHLYVSSSSSTCSDLNGTARVDSVSGGTSPFSFTWSPMYPTSHLSANGMVLDSIQDGTYLVVLTDDNHCQSSSQVAVDDMSGPHSINITTTNVRCHSEYNGTASILLNGGAPPFTFDWAPYGSDTSYVDNLGAGTYTVTITDANQCTITRSFIISQPDSIRMFVNGPVNPICIGQHTLISATASGGTPPYHYYWDNGLSSLQTHIIGPIQTAYYSAYVVDANGCISISDGKLVEVYDSIRVSLFTPTPTICSGSTATIHINQLGGSGAPYTQIWSDIGPPPVPGSTRVVTPLTPTTYTLDVMDFCGSPGLPASITIDVLPLPSIHATGDTLSACEPLHVIFTNLNDSGYSYLWNFGDPLSNAANFSHMASPSHVYSDPGYYDVTVVVTTQDNCSDTVVYPNLIIVFPDPDAKFDWYPLVASAFHSEINFYDRSTENNIRWDWSFDDGDFSSLQDPVHRYAKPDSFFVKLVVFTDHGCKDSVINQITIQEEHTFYAPTAFTPGSSSGNPDFYPFGTGIDQNNYHFYVYDRWGELIFETAKFYDEENNPDANAKWNGRVWNKGKVVEAGVYSWYVWLKDVNGIEHDYAGIVTVIK